MEYLLVFFGSGVGGTLRFMLYRLQSVIGISAFPVATLACNFVGSILIVLFSLFIKDSNTKLLFITGVLGGFTTYSAFVLELATITHCIPYLLANVLIITFCILLLKVFA